MQSGTICTFALSVISLSLSYLLIMLHRVRQCSCITGASCIRVAKKFIFFYLYPRTQEKSSIKWSTKYNLINVNDFFSLMVIARFRNWPTYTFIIFSFNLQQFNCNFFGCYSDGISYCNIKVWQESFTGRIHAQNYNFVGT